jgi:hypothetical protein
MLLRTSLLVVTLLFVTIPTVSASIFAEESASLKRALRIDRILRTSTGDILREQQIRARLLMSTSVSIEHIWKTWNLVPTTDTTLSYTLTLQKYALSCEIAAMKAVF